MVTLTAIKADDWERLTRTDYRRWPQVSWFRSMVRTASFLTQEQPPPPPRPAVAPAAVENPAPAEHDEQPDEEDGPPQLIPLSSGSSEEEEEEEESNRTPLVVFPSLAQLQMPAVQAMLRRSVHDAVLRPGHDEAAAVHIVQQLGALEGADATQSQ